ESVPAAARQRLRDEGRAELFVQPGEGEAAAPTGGRLAPACGRLLVPDERLAAVHAEPAAECGGVRSEPEQQWVQGDVPLGPVAAGLPRCGAGREGRALPARLDR